MKLSENFNVIDQPHLSIVHAKKESAILQDIKSSESILQINKLHDALDSLEETHNNQIARKYLIGFLEEKGFASFKDYIKSLY